jgi:hypothetical protein
MSMAFEERVDESRVAEILGMIGSTPHRRFEPQEGDVGGEFDFWFDGGACRNHTGSQHYVFADGTEAHAVAPAPWLNVNIVFPDGRIVDVVQRRVSPGGQEAGPGIRLDRLQG